MSYALNILIVEDNEASLFALSNYLRAEGYNITEAKDFKSAAKILDDIKKIHFIDVIITDLKLPDGSGIEILKIVKSKNFDIDVLITTGFSSVKTAVEAIKSGAYDYITKPINLEELNIILKRIVSKRNLLSEINELKIRLEDKFSFGNLITKSKKMIEIINIAIAVSNTNSTVLIEGESGTGKELLANIIVNSSERKNKPFIKLNCAALSETILESELFGHEKGSFTGADSLHKGRFEVSDGGTIFLDEIGEIPLKTQAKILRVLQEKEFERVGGNKTIKVDIRIIAASQDIADKVKKGEFRQERKEDIPLLINKFTEDFSKEMGKNIKGVNERVLNILLDYNYPGNIRELKNIIEFMVAVSANNDIINENILPAYLNDLKYKNNLSNNKNNRNEEHSDNTINSGEDKEYFIKIPFNMHLEDAENLIILKTLLKNSNDKVKTSKVLNIFQWLNTVSIMQIQGFRKLKYIWHL
ncbi:MAG: sigma-54 dependent transcriptional regulator, partial [Deltaproteobacteria bacterium]|nr:sigma-54 dependent transcriptional regulator [Deltaproteobacteria bacterium]